MPKALFVLMFLSFVPTACCSGQSAESCTTCREAEDPEAGTSAEPCSVDPDASDDAGSDGGGTGGSGGSAGASTGGAAGAAGSGG
jgi:hypothetical protein